MVACGCGRGRSGIVFVRSGTVNESGNVPGFLSVFVDNRSSFVARMLCIRYLL